MYQLQSYMFNLQVISKTHLLSDKYDYKIQQSGSFYMCVCMMLTLNDNDTATNINCNRTFCP